MNKIEFEGTAWSEFAIGMTLITLACVASHFIVSFIGGLF